MVIAAGEHGVLWADMHAQLHVSVTSIHHKDSWNQQLRTWHAGYSRQAFSCADVLRSVNGRLVPDECWIHRNDVLIPSFRGRALQCLGPQGHSVSCGRYSSTWMTACIELRRCLSWFAKTYRVGRCVSVAACKRLERCLFAM